MPPEMPEMARRGPDTKEKVDPEKVLDEIIHFAKRVIENAEDVKTLLDIAKEKGIKIDIGDYIRPFTSPHGELIVRLIDINARVLDLKTAIAKQGLKITDKEFKQYKEIKNLDEYENEKRQIEGLLSDIESLSEGLELYLYRLGELSKLGEEGIPNQDIIQYFEQLKLSEKIYGLIEFFVEEVGKMRDILPSSAYEEMEKAGLMIDIRDFRPPKVEDERLRKLHYILSGCRFLQKLIKQYIYIYEYSNKYKIDLSQTGRKSLRNVRFGEYTDVEIDTPTGKTAVQVFNEARRILEYGLAETYKKLEELKKKQKEPNI